MRLLRLTGILVAVLIYNHLGLTKLYSQSKGVSTARDSFIIQLLDPDELVNEIEAKISSHKYIEAIQPILYAIEYFQEDNDFDKVYYYKFSLAKIYMHLGWYDKAVSHLEYCQVHFRQEKRSLDLVRCFHALAYVYKKLNNPDMSYYFLNQCHGEKVDKYNEFCSKEHALVESYLNLPQLKSSAILNETYQYSKSINNLDLQIKALEALGEYHYLKHNYKQACIVNNKAFELSKLVNYHTRCKEFSFKLYQCNNQLMNYKEASENLLNYIHYQDTLNLLRSNEELTKIINRFENKEFQDEKIDLAKDKRLFELRAKRSNITLYSLLFSIAAILIAGYFVILYYQQKLETSTIIHQQNQQIQDQKIVELETNIQMQSMQSMINGQEYERERIAKDLHDSLGGLLSTIRLRFDNILHEYHDAALKEEFVKLHDMLDIACKEVRNISQDLTPGSLEKLGVRNAIRDMLNRYKMGGGPDITFQEYGFTENSFMNPSLAINIYRIIQELVNNAIKHAKATEILVQMACKNNELEITVEDDGMGYDADQMNRGMGLENIRSRVNYVKGEIHIDSTKGQGTSVLIMLPLY